MIKWNLIALSAIGILNFAALAHSAQIAGENFEVYVKVDLSLDISDPDDPATDRQLSISSNTSRLGFKGKHKMENGMSMLFQLEQTANFDETGGALASRNSFAGISGRFGTLLVGHHDTPFKEVATKFDLFGNSVADRRSILGASATNGNKMNDRGENMILYTKKFSSIAFKAMYSASNPTDDAGGSLDDNDNDLISLALFYKDGPWFIAGGFEDWSNLAGTYGQATGIRFTTNYTFNNIKVGLIYESIDSDTSAQWERDAYAVNGSLKIGHATTLKTQMMIADDYEGVSDSGAMVTSVGISHKIDKHTEVYAVYTSTNNEDNAAFQGADGGHGDEIKTVLGGDPSAFSIGFKFSI